MLILLSNDDGIYAPGLAALEHELRKLGEVYVVAPASEQSGVSHSITYLTPLIAKEVYIRNERYGWAVDGTPADCVKMGISEFCPRKPDLLVSGINGGLNAGINVLYSGTMAAAIEGAFFDIPSFAVSLEHTENARFDLAAAMTVPVIQQVLDQRDDQTMLYNINVPTAAIDSQPQVKTVPMDVEQYWEQMDRRVDPAGRAYYWVTGGPQPNNDGHETDLSTLYDGNISLTPMKFDLTDRDAMATMQQWPLAAPDLSEIDQETPRGPDIRFSRTRGE